MAALPIRESLYDSENIPPKNCTKIPQKKGENTKKGTQIALQPLGHFKQNVKNVGNKNRCMAPKNLQNICKESEENISKNRSLSGELIVLAQPISKQLTLDTSLDQRLEIEYEDEIYQYLSEIEATHLRPKMNYMLKQMHLNWDMRSILVDWLASVAEEYKINEKTLHLSVIYLDKFLSSISVIREKFQLVGAATMFIAGKVEEIYPPDAKEWAYLTGDTYTVHQIIKMEQLVLKVLNFNINPPTILDFIKHLCHKHKFDEKTTCLAMYLSELVLLEGKEFLKYAPSELAVSSIILARHTLFQSEPWDRSLEDSSGYTLKQLSQVVKKQHYTFKNALFRNEQAIQTKYKSEKFHKVALLKPKTLILDDDNDNDLS